MITLFARKCNSFWEKTKGLLGKNKPEAIYFETRWGIHTFGMQFPIDVIILNKQNKIVAMKKNMKPNRIFVWNPRYKKVIEVPEGIIKKKSLELNEVITLQTE